MVDKDAEIVALKDEDTRSRETILLLEKDGREKEALIEELDSAAVKISIELDRLSEMYSELVSKYENAAFVTEDIDNLRKKADAYDKIVIRAKEKKHSSVNAQSKDVEEKEDEKQDIDSILTGSAQEILEHIKDAQEKFSEAILNAQRESELLKERVNEVINSSKKRILSQIK